MRLAWLTDIHLNFVDDGLRREFFLKVKEQADAVAISGDIAESHDIAHYLWEMQEVVQKPIYFVLGNHDFYRGSIKETRLRVAGQAQETEYLNYLTAMGAAKLTPATAIIGHDGWPDGSLGNFRGTEVILNDHLLIAEISRWYQYFHLDKASLRATMTALADEAARHFGRVLEEAAAGHPNVIAVTHVPPYKEAAWYQSKTSSDDFLPYFACKAVGDVLTKVMKEHPQTRLTVLCGHTHGGGELQVLNNLRVLTGEARYGQPAIQQVLEIE
jgi:Icc protein